MFLPYPQDAHPDHVAVTRIGEDARFDAKLSKVRMPVPVGLEEGEPIYPMWVLYYYCSHLRAVPDPSFLIDTSAHSEQKLRSVLAYKSQFGPGTNPKNQSLPELLRCEDAYMGSRIGAKAAEPFWTKEPLGLTSLASLVGVPA
jgi:LmbE family N-acetylglucosaminyl deacetylase